MSIRQQLTQCFDNYLSLSSLYLAGHMTCTVDQMLSYKHVEDADDEKGHGIEACKSEENDNLRVIRAPFFGEGIANFNCHVVKCRHILNKGSVCEYQVTRLIHARKTYLNMRCLHRRNSHNTSQDPYQYCDAYCYSRRSPATVRVKFAERINNSEESVPRQSSQSENRHADTQILKKFGCLTDELAPRPSFNNKDDRRKGHLESVGGSFQSKFQVQFWI